jgi:hypothetical protein
LKTITARGENKKIKTHTQRVKITTSKDNNGRKRNERS